MHVVRVARHFFIGVQGVALKRRLHQFGGSARVGKAGLELFARHAFAEGALGARAHGVGALCGNLARNEQQFILGIIGKVNRAVEAAFQAGVLLQQFFRFLGVAGKNDGEAVFVAFNKPHQGIERLFAVVVAIACNQRVCFIHKKHAAKRTLHHFLRLRRSVSCIFAHQIAAADFHQLVLLDGAGTVEYVGKAARHCGFARARIASEQKVAARLFCGRGANLGGAFALKADGFFNFPQFVLDLLQSDK